MDASRFSTLREKRFFPRNDITMTSYVGATYLKMCRHVSRITFGDVLAHLVQKLWSLIGLPAAIMAGARVEGFLMKLIITLSIEVHNRHISN